MRAAGTILGALLCMLLLAAGITAIRDFRSAEYTEYHVATTAVGVTSANVTLTQDLFDNQTAHVTITSNVTGDAAVPSTYTASTNQLLISGLTAGATHYLTVVYRYGQLDSYWAVDLGSRSLPLFLILGIIGVVIGAVIASSRRE